MLDQIVAKLTKPSWLSTEFIVTLVTTVVSQLVALGWISTTSSDKVQAHVQAYAQLAVFVIAAAYALSRAIAKHGLAGLAKQLLLDSSVSDPTSTAVAQQAGYVYSDPTPGSSQPQEPPAALPAPDPTVSVPVDGQGHAGTL